MYTSTIPDLEISDQSLFDHIFGSLSDDDLNRVALIDPKSGTEMTYGRLRADVETFAGALAHRGAGLGTVVAILSPNVPAFATAFHGVLRAGATATTVNGLYSAAEIEKQLRDANATWIITVSPLLPQAAEAASGLGLAEDRIIVLDGAEGFLSLAELLAEGHTAPAVTFDSATHLAVLPYSSGTTGVPKGVMLSHRNLVSNLQQLSAVLDITREDRVLAVLPFFHIYGMNVILNLSLLHRATLVTMPKFDLVEFLQNVQTQRCTFLFIAPPIAVAMAKHPIVNDFDISSVRMVICGAAPLDGETGDAAARRLGARLLQGFGMTELACVSHVMPHWRDDIPVSSVGTLVPNQRCIIIDLETGEEITELDENGTTRPGEMLLAGPNVMLGYLNRPDATAESIDADGFFHTGDVVIYSDGGYFTVVDRVKELIKYKGYQVAPAELEAVLLRHPLIIDAAVIGVLDDDKQEIPKAFVVTPPDSGLTSDDVIDFVATSVAPYKRIRRVEFIDAIPKTAAGKILRKDLRLREKDVQVASAAPSESPA